MLIKLTYHEIMQAAHCGVMRQVENLKKNRQAAYGAGRHNDWQLALEGCLGEMAVARHLQCYWSGKGEFRGFDVGTVQVRTTRHEDGRLILHPKDNDDHQFWLVTGINGVYRIRGWIYGFDGKKEEFWEDPKKEDRHAFFVPQHKLMRD